MITYHALDSMTLMKVIEIIERQRWKDTTNRQSIQQDDAMIPSVLKSIRNAMQSLPLNVEVNR